MPIYAYRCESCGFGKDVLQKMSDAPLTDCPECGKSTFRKQVTAAGFQLKGSGWYVTDFRSGGSNASNSTNNANASSGNDAAATKGTEGMGSKPEAGASSASSSADAPAATPAATPAAPATGAGGT
ncbi:FmdB family zinc ribbon protein [Paraburkholderia flava]|uniref:FmdB family zinc ribbon protein n=1 Tax=Paraburkholderia flava TaxID=2547393 RepID=UPI00105CF6AC|nr:FmdB family zinc ribbon protein [Paraburkholderia flava]